MYEAFLVAYFSYFQAFSDDRSVALDSYVGGGENAAKKQRAEGALSLEVLVLNAEIRIDGYI